MNRNSSPADARPAGRGVRRLGAWWLAVAAVLAAGVGVLPAAAAARDVPAVVESHSSVPDAARRFLDHYVDGDGRVVRHDQGGDTVSEGQAYAMTIAAAIGDEPLFRRIWSWTDRQLGRPDGLFAWHWRDGAVVDAMPASDADLLIAGALALAGRRFADAELTSAAATVSTAILDHETVDVGGRPVLVAGPWARAGRVVNPSYLVLPVMSRLWSLDPQWAHVAASSRDLLEATTATDPALPPDWVTVEATAEGDVSAAPAGSPPVHGWDAVRVAVQLAADCTPRGRAVAARTWEFHLSQDVAAAAVYALDGHPLDPHTHAAALVGAAGAASAAGATGSMAALLSRAEQWDRSNPTYYGAAWVALGTLWLTTDLLGGCATESKTEMTGCVEKSVRDRSACRRRRCASRSWRLA